MSVTHAAGMKSKKRTLPIAQEGHPRGSIVDRFLEHATAYVFLNGGEEEVYLASAGAAGRGTGGGGAGA